MLHEHRKSKMLQLNKKNSERKKKHNNNIYRSNVQSRKIDLINVLGIEIFGIFSYIIMRKEEMKHLYIAHRHCVFSLIDIRCYL